MVDKDLLKGAIYRNHLKLKDVADYLNVKGETLSRKILKGRFSLDEINQLCSLLNLNKKEVCDIFLHENVTKK